MAILLGLFGSIIFFSQITNTQNVSVKIKPTRPVQPSNNNNIPSFPRDETPTNQQTIPTTPDITLKASTATIKTTKGNINISLYRQDAPNTVTNFVKKSKSNYYKDLTFHRVEDWVIQGGDPMKNGTGGGNMPTELNDKQFVIGAVGVARGQDIKISNDSQFFITKKDSQFLNGLYTNFGIVTEGMDVVEKIEIGDKIIEISIQ